MPPLSPTSLVAATLTAERILMAVILVVEDDVFIREVAEMLIQDWDHQTLAACDVNEALVFLRSAEHIDAIFTDIYLRTNLLGGCEIANEAIKLRPKLRILYTTGNSVTAKMTALFVEGSQCLLKPYTPKELQCSVENMLAA
jgi:CheY-like chemotaxis protein